MQFESRLCQICPLKEVCSLKLTPSHATGRRLVNCNPWNCRHLTCPAGVDRAKQKIKRLKSQKIFRGYAYFQSPDKPSERRVLMSTGIIESQQDGIWYSTGQSIHKEYSVDPQYFPYQRIRL